MDNSVDEIIRKNPRGLLGVLISVFLLQLDDGNISVVLVLSLFSCSHIVFAFSVLSLLSWLHYQ